jgi:hypothetical protein
VSNSTSQCSNETGTEIKKENTLNIIQEFSLVEEEELLIDEEKQHVRRREEKIKRK